MTGALIRAFLVLILVVTPSLLVPGESTDTRLMVVLLGLFAAVFTAAEYAAPSPGLIDFRDAAPFNRLRYVALFAMLLLSSIAYRAPWDNTVSVQLLHSLGSLVGNLLDFPYSPVRALVNIVPENAPPEVRPLLLASVGLSIYVSGFVLAALAMIMRANGWPTRDHAFNLWVNLPTFDPTAGSDLVRRLNRSAAVNFALAIAVPILLPLLGHSSLALLDPMALLSPQTTLWIVALWAFLPTCFAMRAIAMRRIARKVMQQRRAERHSGAADEGLLPA
ncbi:hypothetical protein [Brevirhabdus sp.]|uniref:hypothetical protein n=1 Tax=Brevirhabdus sp. TaxID=2004514 RepID=UPI0040590914